MMRADGAPPLLQIDDVIPIAFYLKVCQLLLAIYLRGGDSHTNAACVHVCASVVRVRGERSGEGRGGTRCCSLTTMIERTKIPDAAQQRATVSRVDICIVGEISPFGFRLYASTLSNLIPACRDSSWKPKPIGRNQAWPNDRFTLWNRLIIYSCASTTT